MCFSATASFSSAIVLSSLGVAALVINKDKKAIPLCAIPLFFGIQQAIEGINWMTDMSGSIHQFTTYGFLAFAFLLWPIYVPIALIPLEKNKIRKNIMLLLLALGILVDVYLLTILIATPIDSTITNNSIRYIVDGPYIIIAIFCYFLATCITPIISSNKKIAIFGTTLTLSLIVSLYFYTQEFISVWCFFGALLSIIIYLYAKDTVKKIRK